jgi:hypothetical protein
MVIKAVLTGGKEEQRKNFLDSYNGDNVARLGNTTAYAHNVFDALRRHKLGREIPLLYSKEGYILYSYPGDCPPLIPSIEQYKERQSSLAYSLFPETAIRIQEQWEREVPDRCDAVLMDESLIEKLAFCMYNGIEYDEDKYGTDYFINKQYDLVFLLDTPESYQNKDDDERRISEITHTLYREMGAEFLYPNAAEVADPALFIADAIRMYAEQNKNSSKPVVYVLPAQNQEIRNRV